MKSDVVVVLSTFPNPEVARQIGAALVERQVAACVNLVPGVQSIYRWQGAVESADEILAVIKTTSAVLPSLKEALCALHPYDVPELLAFTAEDGLAAYLDWVAGAVSP